MSAPATAALIKQTLTETVRNVPAQTLSLPYVTYAKLNSAPKVMPYPLTEVVTDYGTDKPCLDALMAIVEKSDCPYVAAWRLAIAERFAYCHAEEVEEMA